MIYSIPIFSEEHLIKFLYGDDNGQNKFISLAGEVDMFDTREELSSYMQIVFDIDEKTDQYLGQDKYQLYEDNEFPKFYPCLMLIDIIENRYSTDYSIIYLRKSDIDKINELTINDVEVDNVVFDEKGIEFKILNIIDESSIIIGRKTDDFTQQEKVSFDPHDINYKKMYKI